MKVDLGISMDIEQGEKKDTVTPKAQKNIPLGYSIQKTAPTTLTKEELFDNIVGYGDVKRLFHFWEQ